MLRRTSKSVKEQVDKMRLPAVVHLWRRWRDGLNDGRSKRTFKKISGVVIPEEDQEGDLTHEEVQDRSVSDGGGLRGVRTRASNRILSGEE